MTDEKMAPQSCNEVLTLEGSSEAEVRLAAANHWGLSEDDVVVKVIEEEKSFFGLFGRKLRAEVRPLYPFHVRQAQERVTRLVQLMDFDLQVAPASGDHINVSGYDSKRLIGRHGDGLKVLDYLSNLMARSQGYGPRVRIDCDGYRRQREKELEQIALDAAQEAMKNKKTIYLEPMASWERRLVHLALKESLNVETRSVGVEPYRKVAIRLIGANRHSRPEGPSRRPSSGERHRRPRGRRNTDRQG